MAIYKTVKILCISVKITWLKSNTIHMFLPKLWFKFNFALFTFDILVLMCLGIHLVHPFDCNENAGAML